jgi:CRP-like cAMP-binding protein
MAAFATSERFEVLEPKDRDRLEALSKLDEFKSGEEIPVRGQAGESLYLVAKGAVEMRAKTKSGEVNLGQLVTGDIFGELEAFSDLPEGSIRYVTREDTIVRAVNKHPLKRELKTRRSLASGLLAVYCRSISEKVRSANEVAVKLAPLPPGSSRPAPPASATAGRAPHLSEEEASWLSLLGQTLAANQGETVVAEGETSRSFYVIGKGRMEVRKRVKAGEPDRTLATLADRDIFGIMSFVDGKPRSASVVAVTPATLAKVEPDMLEKATHLNFTVSFKFLGTLCGVLGRTYRDTAKAILANA